MTNKTYSVVGITAHSADQGTAKVRFANDFSRRVKILTKDGTCTRCDLIELPKEMTKVDALNYMLTLPEFASPADQATIQEAIDTRVKAPKAKAPVVKAKPSLDAIKARSRKATTTAQDVLDAVEA
jgi:hypothetical protein